MAEELLVESIQAEESLFSTAMLFAGFLVVLAFKLVGPNWGAVTAHIFSQFPFHQASVACYAILLRP